MYVSILSKTFLFLVITKRVIRATAAFVEHHSSPKLKECVSLSWIILIILSLRVS